jgi:competence protein ComEC
VTRIPGLLPWQVLFLACACGAWGVHDAQAGAMAAALVALGNHVAGRATPRLSFILLAALAGFAYASLRLPTVPPSPDWMDQRAKGLLAAEVAAVKEQPGDRLEVILADPEFRFAEGGAAPLAGRLVCTWRHPAFRPTVGSQITLQARPHPTGGFDNPGGEDWAWRWRLRDVFFRAYVLGDKGVAVASEAPLDPVTAWRLRLREAILDGAGHDSAGGMVLGITTGERFAVARADRERVRRASMAHLLAVSGMNLAPVVAMGWMLAWLAGLVRPGIYLRLPRPKLAVLLGFPLTLGYLWLGRFELSLTRAWLMFAAWGTLLLLGRTRVLLDGLCYALAAMFLWNPLCVFDVGLQLSAAAVAGITLLAPLAGPAFKRLRGRGRILRLTLLLPLGWLLVALACQLAVAPILATAFGEFSPHLYLNLFWLPVVEWIAQPLAYLGALTVTWLPSLGNPLLAGAASVCRLLFDSLKAMDAGGWLATYPVERPWPPEALGYWLLLGGLIWARGMQPARRTVWLGLCAALLVCPALWRFLDQSRDRVRLTMLDVGQGQALLIEAPGGKRWLVDGGGSRSGTFDVGRSVLAPALTWGRPPALDGVVMSREDRDHTGGLVYLLRSFHLGCLAGNGRIPAERDFARALAASGLTPKVWRAGDRIDLHGGLALEVLNPPEGEDSTGKDDSLVLRLVWRGRGLAMLPGDAGRKALEALAGADRPSRADTDAGAARPSGDALDTPGAQGGNLAADVLITPRHGSKSALAPGFYQKVGARWAFTSCARGNGYGYPSPDVTNALRQAGATALSTAYGGAVTATWDSPEGPPTVASSK